MTNDHSTQERARPELAEGGRLPADRVSGRLRRRLQARDQPLQVLRPAQPGHPVGRGHRRRPVGGGTTTGALKTKAFFIFFYIYLIGTKMQ